jgi:probable rRNA maturation factor
MFEIIYKDINEEQKYEKTIQKVLEKCFQEENIEDSKLTITITLTNSENIRRINEEYRHIDKATDVLSFPMFEKEEVDALIKRTNKSKKKEEIRDVLGDIIISIEKVKEQAEEYGHSFERELAYMVVHSFYHLMGYDHMVEEDKIKMRAKEDEILNKLNMTREG